MSIETFLENMRAKPEHIRRRFAFWTSFGFAAVVFVFWLASFTAIGNTAKGTVAQAVNKAGTPAQSLVAGVGSFFYDIKDMIFGPKKISYSSVEVSPGNR
jgi:hypothetical protein